MQSLRLSQVSVLIRQDLRYALGNARGLLFLVFFGIFWFWILKMLSGGTAQKLTSPDASGLLAMMFDPKVSALFLKNSPTLSAYFVIALKTAPLICMIAACDQTASDIGTRHIRFLAPRCNRIEIFVGRYLGSGLLIAGAYLLSTLSAFFLAWHAEGYSSDLLVYALQITLTLALYALPFVGLMSLVSASVGSSGLSALLGIVVYVVFIAIIYTIEVRWPESSGWAKYLLPSVTQDALISADSSEVTHGILLAPLYASGYGALGWFIFSKRDI